MQFVIKRIKDPFPGLSHWFGVLLAVAGTIVLLREANGDRAHLIAYSVYGLTLIALYIASATAHSVRCSREMAAQLDRLDYMAIFMLVAGTYTPVCMLLLRGRLGATVLLMEWVMALVGVALIGFGRYQNDWPRTVLYVMMGWLGVVAAPRLVHELPSEAIAWLLGGGVFYSVGAVIYVTDWPHLWPGRFAAHDLWHTMVLAGSACHFIFIWRFVG